MVHGLAGVGTQLEGGRWDHDPGSILECVTNVTHSVKSRAWLLNAYGDSSDYVRTIWLSA